MDSLIKVRYDGSNESYIKLLKAIDQLPAGKYQVQIIPLTNELERAKKAYYACVNELAKFAGYLSRVDRDLFHEEVKAHLGGESVDAMTTVEDIGIKIEQVHQLAKTHYEYTFPQFGLQDIQPYFGLRGSAGTQSTGKVD